MTGVDTGAPPLQAIALLDTLDKDVNTFVMRVKEWYGWHFPELAKVVADNYQYARIVILAKDKSSITDDMVPDLKEVVGEQDLAEQVRHPDKCPNFTPAIQTVTPTMQTVLKHSEPVPKGRPEVSGSAATPRASTAAAGTLHSADRCRRDPRRAWPRGCLTLNPRPALVGHHTLSSV